MPEIMATCPSTGKPIPVRIAMPKPSFEASTFVGAKVSCPHCGQAHTWNKEDAYLEGEGGPRRR
jgi:hypothetical protein